MSSSNKNLFFAVLLVITFLVGWEYLVVSKYAPPPAPVSETTGEAPKGLGDSSVSPAAESKTITDGPKGVLPPAPKTVKSVVLETENSRVQFTTQGAAVESWQVRENGHWVELDYDSPEPEKLEAPWVEPLTTFPKVNFSADQLSPSEVIFTGTHPSGLIVEKKIHLEKHLYISTVELELINPTQNAVEMETKLVWGAGLGKEIIGGEEISDKQRKKDLARVRAEIRGAGLATKVKTWRPGFIFDRTIDKTDKDKFQWVGVDNNHFIAAFLAPEGEPFTQVHIEADKQTPPVVSLPVPINLGPGEKTSLQTELFVGPKKISVLKEVGRGLPEAVDYGFFGVISKFLLASLQFFHSLTGNFGWAIIILTICYQILVLPLTKKSMEHTVRMKEVQPQLKKIQAQFKSDPKRLQVETFNLYRKNGMKFMGMEGCFPMLIQIPFFFAIYRTLQVAYPLRDAPWIFWVHDLASPDPYFILPILMGAATFVQQKFSTATVDPAQQKIMFIMPVFLVVIFVSMPAGLVLYWFTQSLVTIIIQRILQARHHPKPA